MHRISITLLIASSALALACRPRFTSGVDPTKQGKDLSPAEVKQLCEAGAGYQYDAFLDHRALYCNLLGINQAAAAAERGEVTSDIAAKAACAIARGLCEDADLPTKEEVFELACGDFEEASNCDSLVGDIETCAGDTAIARYELAGAAPQCEDALLETLADYELKAPMTCDSVIDECPEAVAIIFSDPSEVLGGSSPEP